MKDAAQELFHGRYILYKKTYTVGGETQTYGKVFRINKTTLENPLEHIATLNAPIFEIGDFDYGYNCITNLNKDYRWPDGVTPSNQITIENDLNNNLSFKSYCVSVVIFRFL
jgi:hypothetical protein